MANASDSHADIADGNNDCFQKLLDKRDGEFKHCGLIGETHVMTWKGDNDPEAILVCLHGFGLCARGYSSLGKKLADKGINTYALDVRGFGMWRKYKHRKPLNLKRSIEDVTHIMRLLKKRHPHVPVFLLGESMGGALGVAVAANCPECLDGLICSAPAQSLYSVPATATKHMVGTILLPGRRVSFAARGVIAQTTIDPELSEHLFSDPHHRLSVSPREGLRFRNFVVKTSKRAAGITRTPVLIVQGINDRLVKAEVVAKLFAAVASKDKQFAIDGEGEHLIFEEGQFSEETFQFLNSWLKKTIGGGAPEQGKPCGVLLNASSLSPESKEQADLLLKLAGDIPLCNENALNQEASGGGITSADH